MGPTIPRRHDLTVLAYGSRKAFNVADPSEGVTTRPIEYLTGLIQLPKIVPRGGNDEYSRNLRRAGYRTKGVREFSCRILSQFLISAGQRHCRNLAVICRLN
jgi:hypothetical protein